MRYAVVTGGARGIGGAITRRLAADGAEVLVVDVDAEAAAVTAAEVGNACTVLVGEVTDDETVTRVAAAVHERGRLDVLVNNVGDFRPASRPSCTAPASSAAACTTSTSATSSRSPTPCCRSCSSRAAARS